MPHVSKHKLKPELLNKLSDKLLAIFQKAQKKDFLYSIFDELFTETEKIMFAKRLAIVLMLDKKIPQHRIVDMLKVSPSTVAKASLKIDIGKYSVILKISKKEKIDIEKIVWQILTVDGIMPPMIGRKYWLKNLKK
jgi:uncharacterized protein YerC